MWPGFDLRDPYCSIVCAHPRWLGNSYKNDRRKPFHASSSFSAGTLLLLSELLLVFSPEEVKQAGLRGHKHKVGLHPRLSSGFSEKTVTNLSLRAK